MTSSKGPTRKPPPLPRPEKPKGPRPDSPYGVPPGRGPGITGPTAASLVDPRDIILAPVVSEKSYRLIDQNQYTFVVHPRSNKTQIKIAIEKIFNVKVDSVNTSNQQGKRKRTRAGYGTRRRTKRAIVTLAPGEKPIEIFGTGT